MRASLCSSLSEEGPSCSTSAQVQVSGRRLRPPASFDEPASQGSRGPSSPTASPNGRRFLDAHTATERNRDKLAPQEAASTLIRCFPPDQPESRSRRTFADTVSFRGCQMSLLRRTALLESVRWLEAIASEIGERFQDRRSYPCGSGRQLQRARCHWPTGWERRQDCGCLRLPEGHVRDREFRRHVPRRTSQSPSRRRASCPSILPWWAPAAVRAEKRSVPKATLCSSAVFLCLVVMAAFVLVLAREMPAYAARKERVCSAGGCPEHPRRPLSTLDVSVDPCHVSHAYVCGGTHGHAASPNDALDRFYDSEVLHVLLRSGLERNNTPTTTLKALIALERCADRSSASQAIEDIITPSMVDRGTSWPAQALRTDRAGLLEFFDVLLDLSINWRVALGFDATTAYSDIDGFFVVSFGEVGALAWHRRRWLPTLDDNAYEAVARNMSSPLTNGSLVLDDEDLEELRRDATVIRCTALSFDAAEQHDLIAPLHKVGDVTGVLSSAEGMTLPENHLCAGFNISSSTVVFLSNEPYLARIYASLAAITGDRALNVTGWIIAYVYAWTATPAFDDFLKVGADGTSTYSLCFLTMQEWLGLAALAASLTRQFPAPRNLRRFELDVFRARPISPKVVAMAEILTTTGRHFRPPGPYFHLDTIDVMYDSFPAQQNTFIAIRTKSGKAPMRSLTNRYYGSLMTARYCWL